MISGWLLVTEQSLKVMQADLPDLELCCKGTGMRCPWDAGLPALPACPQGAPRPSTVPPRRRCAGNSPQGCGGGGACAGRDGLQVPRGLRESPALGFRSPHRGASPWAPSFLPPPFLPPLGTLRNATGSQHSWWSLGIQLSQNCSISLSFISLFLGLKHFLPFPSSSFYFPKRSPITKFSVL